MMKCDLCNNKIKSGEFYCWLHNDKPKKKNRKQIEKRKQEIKSFLKETNNISKAGPLNQLIRFRDDISRNFQKEKVRFNKIQRDHDELMKIWEELFQEEYQVIPNKMKKNYG